MWVGNQARVPIGKISPSLVNYGVYFDFIGRRLGKFPGGNYFMNIHELWGFHVRKENFASLLLVPRKIFWEAGVQLFHYEFRARTVNIGSMNFVRLDLNVILFYDWILSILVFYMNLFLNLNILTSDYMMMCFMAVACDGTVDLLCL